MFLGLGVSEGLRDLVEFPITTIRPDEASTDCDDSSWSRQLELEVCVVGDGHESCESWLAQDCIVL